MLGVLGYYLVVAAVYTVMSHSGLLIQYRKLITGILMFFGLICISIFFFNEHEYTPAFVAGVLSLIGLIPLIQKAMGKSDPVMTVDLPAGSYKIRSLEELNQGRLTLKYVLIYGAQQYYLSTIPSAGEPAVRLIVHVKPGEKIHFADLIETGGPVTLKKIINNIEKLAGFAAAILLPVMLKTADSSVSYSIFSALLGIIVGSLMSTVTANSEQMLGRAVRLLGRILMIMGIAVTLLHIFTLFK